MRKAPVLFYFLLIVCFTSNYSSSQKQAKKAVTKTTKTTTVKTTTSASKSSSSQADIDQGKELVSKSDCLSCHQEKVKIVGPAYNAVAAKYPATTANINKLAGKIIKGGAGAWGPVPMTPHPAVPVADAKKMVQYILSLKGK